MFVDRQEEIAFLNDLLTRKHPGPAQLLLMYGRRRVGSQNCSFTGQRRVILNLRIGKLSRKPLPNNALVCLASYSMFHWQTHDILLGECKWGVDRVDRQVVRDLVDGKTPLLLNDLARWGQGLENTLCAVRP